MDKQKGKINSRQGTVMRNKKVIALSYIEILCLRAKKHLVGRDCKVDDLPFDMKMNREDYFSRVADENEAETLLIINS